MRLRRLKTGPNWLLTPLGLFGGRGLCTLSPNIRQCHAVESQKQAKMYIFVI